jgi:hypothetical protein
MYQVAANFYSQTSFNTTSSNTCCSSGENGFSGLLSGDTQGASFSGQMTSTSMLTGTAYTVKIPNEEDKATGMGMQVFFSAFPVDQSGTAMAGWWQSEMQEMGCQQQVSMERSEAGNLYYKFTHTTTVTLTQSITSYFSGVTNGQDYQSVVDEVSQRLSQGLPELEDKTVSLDGQIVKLQHACETLRISLAQQSGQGISDVSVKLDHLVHQGKLIYSSFSMYNASIYQEGSNAGMLTKIVASYQHSAVAYSTLQVAQHDAHRGLSTSAAEQHDESITTIASQSVYVQRRYNSLAAAVSGKAELSYAVVQQVLQVREGQVAA